MKTYPLDVELNEPLEDAIGDVVNEMEEAIANIRRSSQPRLVHTVDVDVHELLAEHQAIALVFTIADVKKLRPDLTDEQAWEVLQMFECAVEDCPDPLYETISQIADTNFPKQRKVKLAEVGKIIADYEPHGDERENLVDLLTDLMHWCEGFGDPFQDFCGSAELHYEEESKSKKQGVRP